MAGSRTSSKQAPALRPRIRVEVPKNGKAGCVWGDGGIVTKVVSGGATETAGVCPDAWRIVNVQGKSLAPQCTAKYIGDLLVAARSGGPYYVVFEGEPSAAEPEPSPETAEHKNVYVLCPKSGEFVCIANEDPQTAELAARLDAVIATTPETEYDIVAGASEINDWLLLGTAASAEKVLAGKRPDLRVDAILNCVLDIDEPRNCPDEETLRKANISAYGGFWAYDNPEYDIIGDYWEHARSFLASAREKNMRVLIHCSMGLNRSAAIACAFLVEKEGFELCEAAALLHNRRGGVLGNEGFRHQLAAFAIKCGCPEES